MTILQDGQRFSSADQLRKHSDILITARIEKKKQQLRGEVSSERKCRQWYQTMQQWFGKDSNSELDKEANNDQEKSANKNTSLKKADQSAAEEYVVPADEFFIRCPISKEVFEKFWDDNEGEFMYRNAVKVLVTEAADSNIYSLGKPTVSSNIKYLIARKPLIVDSWLESGSASTLNEAIERYKSMGKDNVFIEELKQVAGEDEDGDDIFVLLELVK